MLAENKEVDEVHHELAENDGKLVPRHERAAKVARCHLGYVHGAYRRGKADAHTTDDAIDIECHQQRKCRFAVCEEEKFRTVASQSGNEEEYTGEIRAGLRLSLEARMPDMALPKMQPSRALLEVMPWITSDM